MPRGRVGLTSVITNQETKLQRPPLLIIVLGGILFTSCATIRPGNDGIRIITEGFASQRLGEPIDSTMKRADTEAQRLMGIYIKDHDIARKKFSGLLGFPFDHSDVLLYASRAEIIKRKGRLETGVRIRYAYAAIPLVAPNAYVSGGLSVMFPGLGQVYQKRGGLGHMALGAVGVGLSIYSYTEFDRWHSIYQRETKIDLINKYYDQSNTWLRYAQYSLAAYSIVTVFSAVDAFTLARGNQRLLDKMRQGGIAYGRKFRVETIAQSGYAAISLSYGF